MRKTPLMMRPAPVMPPAAPVLPTPPAKAKRNPIANLKHFAHPKGKGKPPTPKATIVTTMKPPTTPKPSRF